MPVQWLSALALNLEQDSHPTFTAYFLCDRGPAAPASGSSFEIKILTVLTYDTVLRINYNNAWNELT